MIGLVAALPRELAGLTRGVKPDAALRRRGVFLYRLDQGLAVAAGMGAERATMAVRALLEREEKVSTLVSVGLAGSCDAQVEAGAVLELGTVVDTLSGARFAALCGDGTLATTSSIASVMEKARLHASYGASVVDMEAATVARLAQGNGLKFRAIKAISDGHEFELASLSRFASAHGHFRTGAFALHTAVRPRSWKHAVELGRGSQRALQALEDRLRRVLLEQD